MEFLARGSVFSDMKSRLVEAVAPHLRVQPYCLVFTISAVITRRLISALPFVCLGVVRAVTEAPRDSEEKLHGLLRINMDGLDIEYARTEKSLIERRGLN